MARVNKAVELLSQKQPIYYTTVNEPSYEVGKELAGTWADVVNVDMEHHPFDVAGLSRFMQGLVDGGPTKSGHRTPAVIVVLPATGRDEASMRANSWMVSQALGCGVHGLLLVHANDPAAVRVFVEATRYPFATQAIGAGLGEGLRGSSGQKHAAEIWGLSIPDYLKQADPWPLNPDGDLLLGLKIENRHALANCEITTRIPGIGFAEWGPGDMGMSLGLPDAHDPPYPAEMQAARDRILAACKSAGIGFLEQVTPENVVDKIKAGITVGAGTRNQEAAEIGRKHTGRTMPW